MKNVVRFAFAVVVMLGVGASSVSATSVLVNNDEWTFSDTGFASAAGTAQFARNVASFFAGGGTGNFLVLSNNSLFVQGQFSSTMASAGHALTFDLDVNSDLATLLAYDGVFLCGGSLYPETTLLTNYVNAGGNVYVAGGSGIGGAAYEAAQWNPFLNNFGLAFGSPYNGVSGVRPTSAHPLFSGVGSLYFNNGNPLGLYLSGAGSSIIMSDVQGLPLLGLYDAEVPEPASMILFGSAGVAALLRRRRAMGR